MSCQQVPRLTEDPYTFTEPPVVATTAFLSSQIQKLQPIKPLNKVQIPQYKSRLNGNANVNGYNTGYHIPVYAKQSKTPPQQKYQQSFQSFAVRQNQNKRSTIFKQTKTNKPSRLQTLKAQTQTEIQKVISTVKQQQQQQQPKQIVTAKPAAAKSILFPPPLPPTLTALVNSTVQQSEICQKQPIQTLPPVQQQQKQIQQQQPRTFLPEQIMPTQISSVSNHSIATAALTSTISSPIYVQQVQTQQQQRQKPGETQKTIIRSSPPQKQQQQQKSQLIVDNLQQFDIESALTATKVQIINQKDDTDAMLFSNSSSSNDAATKTTAIASIGGVKSNKIKNNSKTFVRPTNKVLVENKLSTTTTTTTTSIPVSSSFSSSSCSSSPISSLAINRKHTGKSQMTVRSKRSYSQSSHHEALQRISSSSRMSNSCSSNSMHSRFTMAAPIPLANEWHAPEAYIFDYAGPASNGMTTSMIRADYIDLLPCTQSTWFQTQPTIIAAQPITRDQRLDMKKSQLRRHAYQYADAQTFRSTHEARRRLVSVARALKKLEANSRSSSGGGGGGSNSNNSTTCSTNKCGIPSCTNDSLALTAYCYLHITLNSDQQLFTPCTAKFSDNSQCRVPVFDISHELPLCREHAWKRDNYNRMLQEQKPKKPPRKKPKPSAMTRPPKRNKKKKKPPIKQFQSLHHQQINHHQPQPQPPQQNHNHQPQTNHSNFHHHSQLQQQLEQHVITSSSIDDTYVDYATVETDDGDVQTISIVNDPQMHHHTYQLEHEQLLQQQQQQQQLLQQNNPHLHNPEYITVITEDGTEATIVNTQEMFSLCENSSAYESSEDTGVGGLSESVISADEIPLGDARLLEEHDLNNVLNQLPADAFNELFIAQQNDPYEPTQEEQEDLERALEAVDEQVKNLEQMTGSTNFLSDFLDVDDVEILDDSNIVVCAEDVIHSSSPIPQQTLVLPQASAQHLNVRGLIHT